MRNVIITGGELFNKGAQAMTFVAADEIRRRFPEHQIFLLSEADLQRPAEEKEALAFQLMGWFPPKFARCQTNPLLRLVCLLRNGKELRQAEAIYRNCDAMVDISGYALGSNWSDANCSRYLNHLEFAKAFHIPVYLMPQSFGPFDFGPERRNLDARIRRLLPTAKVIFAREQEGYDALVHTYGLKNVRLAHDLVLANRGITLSNVFKNPPVMKLPEILPESVAVIPNSMNANVSSQDTVLTIYTEVIDELLRLGKKVYLLSHSTMDASLCRSLKERFEACGDVILLERDFSCLEFNALVAHFQYLVASRFHSIVHAYKNGVPCIALGWATKYQSLLALFGQEQYVFDVRSGGETASLLAAIQRMNDSYAEEALQIRQARSEIQKENVFDVLTEG